MSYTDIILLVILLLGSILINWSTLRRDLKRLVGRRRRRPTSSKTSQQTPGYRRNFEEAA